MQVKSKNLKAYIRENNVLSSIKISVIIPVYNVEKYIERAINSVIRQTYKNLEIILIDDGSTDNSGLICNKYAGLDERIQVIHKENGGLVSARKAGIRIATGDYVVNLDSDDWIECDAYENVVKIIEEYGVDVVAYGVKKEFEGFVEEQAIQLKQGRYSKEKFWREFCSKVAETPFYSQPISMSQWDKVAKIELYKECELNCSEKLNKNEDDAAIFPMLLNMNNIYIDSRCWYHYCVRKNSILWHTDKSDYDRYKILALHLINSYSKLGNKSGCSKEFLLYKLVHHLMLDNPELLFNNGKCNIYPDMLPDSRIIVYGKGVFANRFMNCIKVQDYCNIIANIDSKDAERLKSIDKELYDYIVIAIFNSKIVMSVLNLLSDMGIDRRKVLIIEKENITSDFLPEEVRDAYYKL